MSTIATTTTEELLKDAAIDGKLSVYNVDHAKHFAMLMLNRDEPEFPHTGKTARFCTVHAETVLMYELEARAELIVRAVNSFAAMREVCRELISKYEAAAEKHAVREGLLAMADNLPYSETAVLPESPLVQAARKALALANNTGHTTK